MRRHAAGATSHPAPSSPSSSSSCRACRIRWATAASGQSCRAGQTAGRGGKWREHGRGPRHQDAPALRLPSPCAPRLQKGMLACRRPMHGALLPPKAAPSRCTSHRVALKRALHHELTGLQHAVPDARAPSLPDVLRAGRLALPQQVVNRGKQLSIHLRTRQRQLDTLFPTTWGDGSAGGAARLRCPVTRRVPSAAQAQLAPPAAQRTTWRASPPGTSQPTQAHSLPSHILVAARESAASECPVAAHAARPPAPAAPAGVSCSGAAAAQVGGRAADGHEGAAEARAHAHAAQGCGRPHACSTHLLLRQPFTPRMLHCSLQVGAAGRVGRQRLAGATSGGIESTCHRSPQALAT